MIRQWQIIKNTICSTGTVIKVRQAVKFNDGTYYPTGYFSSSEERKIILNKISNNLKGVTSNGNTIVINGKEFDYISKFDDIITILDFLSLIEKCLVYELDAVSTNKYLPWEKRRLGEKYFLVGEEKELIEWAAINQIWHWLTEKTRLSQQARGSHKELAFGQALSAATKSINEKLEKGNRKYDSFNYFYNIISINSNKNCS